MSAQKPTSVDDLAKRLEALEQQVETLQAERAILETFYRYGHALDYGDLRGYQDVFTEDTHLRSTTGTGQLLHEEHGYAGLADFFGTKKFPPQAYDKHLVHQPLITVNGAEATVDSYWSFYIATGKGPLLQSFGRYRDTLVKCPDGRWRIRERIVTVETRS